MKEKQEKDTITTTENEEKDSGGIDKEIEEILSKLPYKIEFGELKLEKAALNCMGI